MAGVRDEQKELFLNDISGMHICLDKLSILHRGVLVLYILGDMTYDNIARIMDCPAKIIEPLVENAKQALKNEMERFYGERYSALAC